MPAISDWNRSIVEEFRANEGRVGGPFEGRPLLLLHHRGARTGIERVNPLAYQRVGEAYAVFGSKGGAPDNPDWYHNVVANPEATIEVGTETIDVVARVPDREERDRIWEEQKRRIPAFAQYEQRTSRQIPVVVLDPVERRAGHRS
jgi:deazaflavin-dependent oxidoreductase (nitroreductase family)